MKVKTLIEAIKDYPEKEIVMSIVKQPYAGADVERWQYEIDYFHITDRIQVRCEYLDDHLLKDEVSKR